jgi:hypothetical protein
MSVVIGCRMAKTVGFAELAREFVDPAGINVSPD